MASIDELCGRRLPDGSFRAYGPVRPRLTCRARGVCPASRAERLVHRASGSLVAAGRLGRKRGPVLPIRPGQRSDIAPEFAKASCRPLAAARSRPDRAALVEKRALPSPEGRLARDVATASTRAVHPIGSCPRSDARSEGPQGLRSSMTRDFTAAAREADREPSGRRSAATAVRSRASDPLPAPLYWRAVVDRAGGVQRWARRPPRLRESPPKTTARCDDGRLVSGFPVESAVRPSMTVCSGLQSINAAAHAIAARRDVFIAAGRVDDRAPYGAGAEGRWTAPAGLQTPRSAGASSPEARVHALPYSMANRRYVASAGP